MTFLLSLWGNAVEPEETPEVTEISLSENEFYMLIKADFVNVRQIQARWFPLLSVFVLS